jgi:hypothetical protein
MDERIENGGEWQMLKNESGKKYLNKMATLKIEILSSG